MSIVWILMMSGFMCTICWFSINYCRPINWLLDLQIILPIPNLLILNCFCCMFCELADFYIPFYIPCYCFMYGTICGTEAVQYVYYSCSISTFSLGCGIQMVTCGITWSCNLVCVSSLVNYIINMINGIIVSILTNG